MRGYVTGIRDSKSAPGEMFQSQATTTYNGVGGKPTTSIQRIEAKVSQGNRHKPNVSSKVGSISSGYLVIGPRAEVVTYYTFHDIQFGPADRTYFNIKYTTE